VGVKWAEQQGRLMQHRTRDLLLRQRTQLINAQRGHMGELGMVAAQGRERLKTLLAIIAKGANEPLPVDVRASLIVLAAQLEALQTMIGAIEKPIVAQHRAHEASKRLASIPGIGVWGARSRRQAPGPAVAAKDRRRCIRPRDAFLLRQADAFLFRR
jgi:transposase